MADEDIASLEELLPRLDWTLSTGEQGVAASALSDLSDDARFYGSDAWTALTAPRLVRSLVLRAAARFMRNPDGFTQSRAGDETVMWSDDNVVPNAEFTKTEQRTLATLAHRKPGLTSAQVTAYGPTRARGPRYINPMTQTVGEEDAIYVDSDAKPFPLLTEGEIQ